MRLARAMAAAFCASIAPAEATTIVVEDGQIVYMTKSRPRLATRTKPQPAVVARVAPVREPAVTPPQVDPSSPPTQPMYPAASRRFEEQGTVVVRVLVLPNGRVGNAWVDQTSGYHRLDDAAIEESRNWRFIPATKGDQPIAGEKKVVIRFAFEE